MGNFNDGTFEVVEPNSIMAKTITIVVRGYSRKMLRCIHNYIDHNILLASVTQTTFLDQFSEKGMSVLLIDRRGCLSEETLEKYACNLGLNLIEINQGYRFYIQSSNPVKIMSRNAA